jgi:hypothetical protein
VCGSRIADLASHGLLPQMLSDGRQLLVDPRVCKADRVDERIRLIWRRLRRLPRLGLSHFALEFDTTITFVEELTEDAGRRLALEVRIGDQLCGRACQGICGIGWRRGAWRLIAR